ncbi:UNVERIFIED_CONTAM: hypothetical protein NCL1_39028, partial [Trichonephila clavipes]
KGYQIWRIYQSLGPRLRLSRLARLPPIPFVGLSSLVSDIRWLYLVLVAPITIVTVISFNASFEVKISVEEDASSVFSFEVKICVPEDILFVCSKVLHEILFCQVPGPSVSRYVYFDSYFYLA